MRIIKYLEYAGYTIAIVIMICIWAIGISLAYMGRPIYKWIHNED